ncbi:MAG: hypothetical protein NTX96_01655 [Candidatus Zambryskibacteria bacterium]|nr:hypothetical protein [Candidatus Zambryskibacteria bacterium]
MEPEKETEQKSEEKTPLPIKSLRTYQGDVEEAVLKNNYSASSILVAEQNRNQDGLLNIGTPKDSGARNKFFILVGSIMLILGVITISAVFYIRSKDQVIIQQQTKTLIGFLEEKIIPITNSTREKLITDILAEKKSFTLPVNSVLYLNTVNASSTPINVENILSLIAPQMPSSLVRSFDGEYMLGVYSFDTNEPFLILTTSDFASSFSGMLKWEKDMVSDFGKLFSISQNTGSTTMEFKDEVLRNKDLRILQDNNKKTILLYSFIDKNTLVITTNENIFNAIIGKYNVSKQIR